MKPSLDEVIARIQAGVPVEEIAASTLAPGHREVLRRGAAARVFNRQIFNSVLAPGPSEEGPGLQIDELLAEGDLEIVPNTLELYRLPPATRERHLNEWLKAGSVEPIRETSRALAQSFEKELPEDRLELLYLLTLSDPARAASLFEELYGAADTDFNLARCSDLVALLEQRDREGLLHDARLQGMLTDFRTYLGARMRYTTDFYQTIQYLEREGLTRDFDRLLKDSSRWILQLYAPGGMGKTMFERWLVATRCIPSHIPCARVDFDVTNPEGARFPWLLLHEIAEDLEQQIPGKRFAKVLDLLAPYRPWLRQRNPNADRAMPENRSFETVRESAQTQFLEVLSDLHASQPVVVIFDTLEELLQRQETPEALLGLLGRMQEQSNGRLRVILAGRYELGERKLIPPEFTGALRTSFLKPFSAKEAANYLEEKRKLTPTAATREVIKKSGGNPLKLALYADLLRVEPGMTAEAIRNYPTVDIAYLIHRIVARIVPRQVRWVLRYGAIPRHLTRRFLEEVMAAPMTEAMSGLKYDDDPLNDPVEEKLRAVLFPTDELGAGEGLHLEQLWRQLGEYAAQFAWVSVPAGEVDTLVFHGDVLVPMRGLLRKYQPRIFERLHRQGFAHFSQRARDEPDQWGRWIGEAIFHHAEFDREDFATFCQGVINEARKRGEARAGFDLVVQIANIKTLPESVQRAAQWAVAIAAVALARRSGDEKFWHRAETALREVHLADAGVKPDAPEGGLTAAAAVAAYFGRTDEAATLLTQALSVAVTPGQRLAVFQLQAEEFLRLGRGSEAASKLENVWLERRDLTAAEAIGVLDLLVAMYQGQLAYDRVVGRCDEALDEMVISPPEKLWITQARFDAMLALGRFAEVRSSASEIAKPLPRVEAAVWCEFEVRAWLCLEEPLRARNCAARVVEDTKILDLNSEVPRTTLLPVSAPAWEALGEVEAALFEFKPALDAFEQARGLYARIPDTAGVDRLTLRIIALALDDIGNLREAEARLQTAERGPQNESLVFLRARFEQRSGRVERATELINQLLQDRDHHLPMRDRLRAHLALMALGQECPPDFQSLLAGVPPPTRIIVLSDALREWTGARISAPEIAALLREFKPAREPERGPTSTKPVFSPYTYMAHVRVSVSRVLVSMSPPLQENSASMALRLAETLSFVSDDVEAAYQLKQATATWVTTENTAALRKCAAAAYDIQGLSGLPNYPLPEGGPLGERHAFMAAALLGRVRWSQRIGDLSSALEFCKLALTQTLLIPLPSRLHAEALERLSVVMGAQGLTKQAAEYALQAAKLYGDLDDPLSAAHAQRRSDARAKSGPAFIRLTVDRLGRRIDVESRMGKNAVLRLREGVGRRPLLDQIRATTPGSIVAEAFLKRFAADWYGSTRDLTALLLESEDLDAMRKLAATKPTWAMPLQIDNLALSSLPWELLVHSRSFFDHFFNRAASELLTISPNACLLHRSTGRQSEARGLPPKERGVVIFAPSQRRMEANARGTGTGRSDLKRYYEIAGFRCRLVEDPTFWQAQEILETMRPAILHLSATMKESSVLSAPYLDFARDVQVERLSESGADSGTFTGSTVKQILSGLPSGETPLLLLDIARPPGLNDTVRQLFLRNSYAAELAAYDTAPAIIAAGLAEPSQAADVVSSLITGLATGKSLGTAVQAIRDLAIPAQGSGLTSVLKAAWSTLIGTAGTVEGARATELDGLLGTAAVALFTEDPTLSLASRPVA